MNKNLRNVMLLSLGLLSASAAMADDAIWGALIGGGAGALVGRSVGGRNGAVIGGALGAATGVAIASDRHPVRVQQRVEYYPSAPIYVAQETYYPPQQVYYSEQVRFEPPPVYYIEGRHDRGPRWRHHERNWDRHDHRAWERR